MMLEDSRFSKSSKSKHQPENHWNQGVRITRSKGSTGLVGARCSTELVWHVRRAERGRCSWSCCLRKTPTQSLFCTWISCKNPHSQVDPSVTPHQIPFGYIHWVSWHSRRAEHRHCLQKWPPIWWVTPHDDPSISVHINIKFPLVKPTELLWHVQRAEGRRCSWHCC